MSDQQLLVVGASARAACFSARRSSFLPYWIDHYGDHDLVTHFPGQRVPANSYPAGILDLIDDTPMVPFLYTGALENHLQILEKLEGSRQLLGNSAAVCRAVRDPERLAACFCRARIKHPQISSSPQTKGSNVTDWLIKPVRSAGGLGVNHYQSNETEFTGQNYLQEFIEGESRAGVFIADGTSAWLMGVTRQLVGEAFLNAGQFSYCGSIGPLQTDENESGQWSRIGNSLTADFGLKGLFGVDAICHAGDIYPLEVNPRYTASVEVLELALQLPVVAFHVEACNGNLPATPVPEAKSMMAKAYLFAGQDLRSPKDIETIYDASESIPSSADIPHGDTAIARGHPLMTVLTCIKNQEDAIQALMKRAKLLYSQFKVV